MPAAALPCSSHGPIIRHISASSRMHLRAFWHSSTAPQYNIYTYSSAPLPHVQILTNKMATERPRKPHLILGLMTIGPPQPGARLTSLAEFTRLLTTFAAASYTHLDTARVYLSGTQEPFTAAALAAIPPAAAFTISTKLYPNLSDGYTHRASSLRTGLLASLAALSPHAVDTFYLHAPDRSTPFTETLAAADALHREGRFRRLGLSNFSAAEVAEVCTLCRERGWVRPSVYQALYNVLSRGIEDELVPVCRRFGVRIVVYNPIAGGLLTGQYTPASAASATPASGRFSDANPTGGAYRRRYFSAAMFAAVATIQAAAEQHGVGLLEVALRWLVHHSVLRCFGGADGDGVVIGVSSEDQLVQDMDAVEGGPLPEEVVAACEEAWEGVRRAGEAPG
ncbi:NADP-dependent oxidoreductase domain-containing protein [Geopyxis carbonaria]|nr:NADP-dependent oxidoreductase domain-containing protein [Geopyxis carbonaria]